MLPGPAPPRAAAAPIESPWPPAAPRSPREREPVTRECISGYGPGYRRRAAQRISRRLRSFVTAGPGRTVPRPGAVCFLSAGTLPACFRRGSPAAAARRGAVRTRGMRGLRSGRASPYCLVTASSRQRGFCEHRRRRAAQTRASQRVRVTARAGTAAPRAAHQRVTAHRVTAHPIVPCVPTWSARAASRRSRSCTAPPVKSSSAAATLPPPAPPDSAS